MGSDLLTLRGHHLLCLLSFQGLGYSPEFVEHMKEIADAFLGSGSARVKLVASCDDVCAACPHMVGGGCANGDDAEARLTAKDATVLEALGLGLGRVYATRDVRELAVRTFSREDLQRLCSDCQWLSICRETFPPSA